MKRSISSEELEKDPIKYVRLVRDGADGFDIIEDGKPIARLLPAKPRIAEDAEAETPRPRLTAEELEEYWWQHRQLAAEISKLGPEGVSAVEAVREQRREL